MYQFWFFFVWIKERSFAFFVLADCCQCEALVQHEELPKQDAPRGTALGHWKMSWLGVWHQARAFGKFRPLRSPLINQSNHLILLVIFVFRRSVSLGRTLDTFLRSLGFQSSASEVPRIHRKLALGPPCCSERIKTLKHSEFPALVCQVCLWCIFFPVGREMSMAAGPQLTTASAAKRAPSWAPEDVYGHDLGKFR